MKEVVLRALVADDEKLARRELKRLLKPIEGVRVVSEAGNGLEVIEKLEKEDADLVFLDIEMPGLNGIQVVEKIIKKGMDVDVIIVTAYDHYAVKAFEINAVDYLLKPVEPERLGESVQRVRERRSRGRPVAAELNALWEALKKPKSKLSLRLKDSSIIVDQSELIFAHVDGGMVTAVTDSVSGILNYRSLDEVSKVLGAGFFRAHRRYLVNIDMIREVIPYFSGTYRLRLKNNVEIPLSRAHARELRKILRF